MRLYEVTAYHVGEDKAGREVATFLVLPEYVFAETEGDAEKMFILAHSTKIQEHYLEEVTILVRPFV